MKGGQGTRDWESGDGKRDGKMTESQDRDGKMEKEEHNSEKECKSGRAKLRGQRTKRGTKSTAKRLKQGVQKGSNIKRQIQRESGKEEADSEKLK